MNLLRFDTATAVIVAALLTAACSDHPATTSSTAGGSGGSGGCPTGPHASFSLEVTAADGPVPANTRIQVTWSAGPEPVFVLDDPTTWKTLESGANIVCDVDPKSAPPTDLMKLTCALWTSGTTEVAVSANGYVTSDIMYSPMDSEACKGPVLTPIDVKLKRPDDAGTM